LTADKTTFQSKLFKGVFKNQSSMNQSSKALSEGASGPRVVGSKMYFRIRKHLAVLMAGDFAAELAKSGTFQKMYQKCQEKSLPTPMIY
jgi:hypothetical protein